jgi:hypothetical protein
VVPSLFPAAEASPWRRVIRMPKDPSPLLGYNNNIRHKNRVFHVQTEDSGVKHPHIITHLFMDGGRILKSVKTSYSEHLGAERMGDVVRKLMKDQHKGMLIALRDGQFDVVIDGSDAQRSIGPIPTSQPTFPAASPSMVASPPASPSEPGPLADDVLRLSPVPDEVAPAVPPRAPEPTIPDGDQVDAATHARPEVRDESPIDVAALERASQDASPSPMFDPPRDMQPPPANLFKPRTGGNYSEIVDAEPEIVPPLPDRGSSRPNQRTSATPPGTLSSKPAGTPGSRPPPAKRSPSAPPPATTPSRPPSRPPRRGIGTPASISAKPSESRYAPARPAAIFGQSRPRGGNSIFGEDIISDKSLDEVILSYLAEDGEGAVRDPPKPATARPDPKRRK